MLIAPHRGHVLAPEPAKGACALSLAAGILSKGPDQEQRAAPVPRLDAIRRTPQPAAGARQDVHRACVSSSRCLLPDDVGQSSAAHAWHMPAAGGRHAGCTPTLGRPIQRDAETVGHTPRCARHTQCLARSSQRCGKPVAGVGVVDDVGKRRRGVPAAHQVQAKACLRKRS